MKIAFIGGGNMGEAIVSAVLDKKLSEPQYIAVSDVSDDRCRYLRQKYGVAASTDNRLTAEKGEVVVLAIKPQTLHEAAPDLRGQLKPSQLVLSILAGIDIATIRRELNHDPIVRAMPNTPAQIGEGISVWTATAEVTEQQKSRAGSILGAMGKEIYVDDERYLDMATAVSGSGPAYFFLFVEVLVEAAVNIGLPGDVARELVLQTMLGSGHLIQASGKEPSELRRIVTTPGGTTAAALAEMEKGGFADLMKRAVTAAYDRARKRLETQP
ncbi:MAG: pyrroline-5-carboxylate reductase [Dehalococcoidales bacterium]|nr:pyrroline-5-carboxylate reductase [Dehalococcoidales bacterium]